jgi:transposase-like protein
MKYSYEYKLECIKLYRQGKWPKTPEGVNQKRFHDTIRKWVRIEDAQGPEALCHKAKNKVWTVEEKLELIFQVMAGQSITKTAFAAGINDGMLYQWVQKYKLEGYNGLVDKKKGRPGKENIMKEKQVTPAPLTESEREELIRLRAENEYIKAENEVIKKEIALRQEKAAQLKAKKQQLSKNSVKKDIN